MRKLIPCLSVSAIAMAVMVASSPVTAGCRTTEAGPSGQVAVKGQTATGKTFNLVNRFPFPVRVRIDGDGPSFPIIVTVPAPPAPGVPVPYPNATMSIKLKKPGRGWSRTFKLNWKAGDLALPAF